MISDSTPLPMPGAVVASLLGFIRRLYWVIFRVIRAEDSGPDRYSKSLRRLSNSSRR
jgi:hypothetical protein